MIILGPFVVRYGSALGVAAVCGIPTAAALDDGQPLSLVALVLLVGVGCWLVGRALRLGVVALGEHFLVRGMLWSRRIPYSGIVGMPDPADVALLPSIRWSVRDRRRWTPLTAFWVTDGILANPARRSAAASIRLLGQCRTDSGRRGA